MFKKLFLLAVTVAVMFLSNIFDTKAECPPNWNAASQPFTLKGEDNEECNLTVYFCWFLDPLGVYHTIITGCYFEEDCGSWIIQNHPTDFHDAELMAVYQWFANHYMLPSCDGGGGGPAYYIFETTSSNCVAIQNFGQTQTGLLLQCPDKNGICIAEYRVCANYNVNPPAVGKSLVSYYSSGDSDCPTSVQIPPDGYTTDDDWISDCFLQICP